MKRYGKMHRVISLALTLVMILGMVPPGTIHVHAVEENGDAAQVGLEYSLDDIAWENLTYRDIFITNNKAYLNGFNDKTFGPFLQNAGTNTVTKDACYTGPYSLAAFGSPSQQIKSMNALPVGEYFVASKVYCTRYAAGELGVCLHDTTVGVTEVTDDFVTAAGIISLGTSDKIYIGSIHSADLDGYVDDTTVVDMSIFGTRPSESELTALYERYVEMEKAIERKEVPYTEQEMLDAFVAYMNEKAASIGMTNSSFVDPIGIDNITTAADLLRLVVYTYTNYEELHGIWGQSSHTVTVGGEKAREQTVTSTVIKPALGDYYHILGGKTGTLSKFNARNLAVILEIPESEDRLAVVALYADGLDADTDNRFEAVRQIADAAIAKYTDPNADLSSVDVCCAGAVACLIPADGVDMGDLEILYEKDSKTQRVPASITKVLSAICALDILDDLAQTVTYSDFDTQIGGYYTKDFYPGDYISFEDALYAMMLPSSNVTARMVAREVGAIILNGTHIHSYTPTVTPPTCTEAGYTTYTCECGESYVADYVDALGHIYENGICTGCGAAQPGFDTDDSEALDVDLFVFAGQSNMMGAAVLEPEVNTFTDNSFEYKYMPKLRGETTGSFVPAQNPAGEFYYNDLTAAYGDKLNDLSYKSTLANYSANTYFCPAMRDGVKGFAAQSEANTYPSASLAPYFVTEYAQYGHSTVYAHMAKGAVKIVHYFTEEMVARYNALITEYNSENGNSYSTLSAASLSGAGDAFDAKYNAMIDDYVTFAPDNTVKNKCFVWLQGESDGGSYIEYKLKMQVLWEHLQTLGFSHFFVLRVGYWGSAGVLNAIKAQEDFCAENDNCYIVTRAPSLIPYPTATTDNWWINEPSAEYDNCRDSYLVDSSNNHFNERAMQIFAERSAENIHRILYLGLDPVLEEENIRGMQKEEELPEDDTLYTSYVGTEAFCNSLSVSQKSNVWKETSSSSAASTNLISVSSDDSVWIQQVFFKSDAHAVGGFYDADGQLVAPLWYEDFGFTADPNTGGVTAFRTPLKTNRVSVADVEAATGKKIAYVRFTAWAASEGGHAGTEARIYHEEHTHTYENGICTDCGAEHPNLANYKGKVISILGDSISTFAGYIPVADGFNLQHYARYPQDNLFTDVEHTWWMQMLTALDAKLGINESWRSTEVGNIYDVEVNSGYEGTKACMASTTRIQNLGSNGTPDVILFYGGTNDITQRRTVGTFDPATAPTEVDLTSVKWDTVADAYVAAIMRMQYYYPNAEIVAMLPTFTYKNTDAVIEEYNSVFAAICEHYGVTYVDLRECGISTSDLPDGTHPNKAGMDYITAAVMDILLDDCEVEAGEHIVHSVTHNLTGAESGLSYYKGISHGKPFTTIISGENVVVTVTIGGVDMTAACYTNGLVSIENVTDDVVITAAGREKTIYDDHLQQLPDELCGGMNLWTVLVPENQYYTGSRWGNLSTGQVWSITIRVAENERIYASSFEKNGSNGNDYSSSNAIRVTWFDADGVLKSLSPTEVYAEFKANGYLTVPADAVAVNIPMWNNSDDNKIYILNRTHTYENGICTGCGATVSPYLQRLPENILGCTDLYDVLTPVKGYYTATKYDTSNGEVLSVVIPVEPGDRIAASSFASKAENMGSVDGIRVTYLLGDKIVTSLSAGDVYNAYMADGYITVPAGVDTVSIPWWKPSDSNWLTLSQIRKDFAIHSAKTVPEQAPTCTEKGYTAGEICEICNASLGERQEIPATGHSYSGDTCAVCGAVNLAAILDGKYVSVLGDSISTFNGYSNDAAVNTTIGGNGPRYDAGAADTKPGSYCLLESVNDTWWMDFANRSGMKLLVNNSWAGSQVFGGKTSDGRVIPAAYLDRCVNLHDNTLENNPGNAPINPDVIFVYLGINDYNFNRSKVGSGEVDYAGLVSSDGTYVTPATFGEAYGIMLGKMRAAYPDARIFAMTLLPENLYSVDKTAWEQHNAYIRAAADYYGIPVVDLAENCAITWETYSGYMIDRIHPTTAGMELIADCIEAELISCYTENPPHTHSYTSTVTAPTCTEQGYTTYTCECGDSYVADYVDALGHRWSSWQQIAEENCQGQGRWMRSCETCAAAQYTQDQEGSCVSFNSPAILANAGDTVVLTYYDVAFDADTVTDAATVAWSSDQLTVDQGCVTPTDPGVYTLVATSGAVSKTVYLVVKDPEDMEYVLYFDDFTDTTLPGYRPIEVYSGARYYVSDGKLILDASNSVNSYIRILLPEWIGNFSDYEIRTTFTMTEALDSTKWFAVMARVQNEDIPYLQAAVRFNATAANGIELAKKDKDNNWVILDKTSYTEAISPSKYYTQTFGLSGTTGYHAINGTTLLKSDTMAYGPGDVGFQVRGAAASIDRIKIVIPVDTAAHTFGDWAVTTAPTCTEPGAEIRSCAVCGHTETRDVDPCHDLVQHAEKMHACTESGWLAYETCTRCDYSTLVEVAPTDHSYQRRIHSVAHRGYSQTAPENTLVAYKLAKDKGYFYVECDVSFTADGIPVLLHDDTIDRTSDGTGKVSELTYEQLLQYDFGSWKSASYAGTRIPTFEEFIALCVELDLHPYIELKKSGSYTQAKIQQLVDMVEAYGMTGKVTWISFSSTFLGYVKNADTAARLGYVYSGDATQSTINVAKSLQTDSNEVFLDLKYSELTNTGILRAATNGFAVEVWTVNSKRAILALPSYVSGVTSDGYHAQDIIDSNFSAVTAPTCTEQGYTTYTCECGDSYVGDYTDPRPLNILMIGNSFSWDAADFWYDMQTSMTYDAMKSMMADPYDVHLAVMYKGSATLAYHATCAMKNTSAYTYTEIGPETNYRWMPSSGTNASNNILDQLEARDWDIIVIQSYQHEADGTEPRSTYTGGDARFTEPEASVGYLLDYFAEREPNAAVYYYMPWATTKFYGSDTETGYHAMAKYTETTVPNLTGTNSGKSFAGIIPVGTGIQNARTTYFDALRFSSGTGSTALLKDPQNGLQYDSQHLSFGLGRYIAGIIVAETLIPQEMRKDSYVLPTVKDSPAVGELPQEYSVIGQLAAKYALQDPFKLTTLADYDTELADRVCDAIKTADYSANGITGETDLQTHVETVVAEKLENMGAAEYSVTIHSFTLENGQIADMEATVTLRVGYTSRSVEIMVTNGMAHPFGEWEIIAVPSAEGPGLNRRVCKSCGFVEEVEVDGSWQKFALAEHMQELPDDFCSETNLWDLLEPEKLMINHLGEWVSAGSTVYSVTIPVKPGDKIYANSFDQTDGRKGIQVSFIGDYGIVKTTFSSETYNAFQANGGYLIAPEGAIAVNIPVWNVNADNNTINFLGYDHIYTPAITAPTCTEQGYTTYTCECGDSYVADYVDRIGHSYEGLVCAVCGKDIQPIAGDDELCVTVTPENYWTVSYVDAEKLACGPGLVTYGDGNFAVVYLADDTNTVETESSGTIVCRIGLFNIKDPEYGRFLDIATAGQTIGDVTIGSKAPYEPNLIKIDDSTLLILFNIRTTDGKYIYYSATFDTTTNTVVSYQNLTLDGKEWTPANVAASYNAIAENTIDASGSTGSMVFTSQIIRYEGYYYGYCGGISNGFGGMLVRSVDGINWTAVLAPEAANDMKGVIECGFQFLDNSVYFCMRDISSGVYHCSYNFSTGEQLMNTEKLPGLTTSKPAAFIQNGKMYLIVNRYTGDDNTVGRRNTAQIYRVDPETCGLTLVKQVFCKDGCAYHTVVEYGGINYWCFHTDARRINPYTQGRSNLALLPIPNLVETGSENGELNFNAFASCYTRGCITVSGNVWQSGAVNMHYQIPLAAFADYDAVTITANADNKCYVAFFAQKMTTQTQIAYAEGWTEQLIMEPGTGQTLPIPGDAQYLYILATNAAGNDLLPESVVFHNHTYVAAVTAPTCTEQGYTTYTCECGDSYVADYVEATGHTYENGVCTGCGAKEPGSYIPGDITGDGELNNKDVTRLFKYLSGYDVEVDEAALDVNGDGEVNNKDVTRLFRYLSGFDVTIH